MGPMNTAALASRFGETNQYFSGSKNAAVASDSTMTQAIAKGYADIKAYAKKTGKSMEKVSLSYLLMHLDSLTNYIQSKGEVTSASDHGIIVQAMLLRMQDISTISLAANISEDDALREIEQAESEAVNLNTSDKDTVMAPEVQAALNCLIVDLLVKIESKTGDGSVQGAMNLLNKAMATPVNNADGDASDPSTIDVAGSLDNNLGIAPVNTSAQLATYANTGTGGDSSDSFFTTLSKIATTASTVASSLKTIGGAATSTILGVSNAVQTAGSNVGASAISLWLQRNGVMLVIAVFIIIILAIVLSRATRN